MFVTLLVIIIQFPTVLTHVELEEICNFVLMGSRWMIWGAADWLIVTWFLFSQNISISDSRGESKTISKHKKIAKGFCFKKVLQIRLENLLITVLLIGSVHWSLFGFTVFSQRIMTSFSLFIPYLFRYARYTVKGSVRLYLHVTFSDNC